MWNPVAFDVDITFQSAQLIHCYVTHKNLNRTFDYSIVYGFNEESSREQLWEDLSLIADTVLGAWFVGENFNNPLNFEDRLGSAVRWRERKIQKLC